MKKRNKIKIKNKTITLSLGSWAKGMKAPHPGLQKAAKDTTKEIIAHFKDKNGGWPLDYSFYVTDIFYRVYGHHLENYLLAELYKKLKRHKLELCLRTKNGNLTIQKV